MNDLKLKVCGLRDVDNIREVIALEPDYVGFIFYTGSPRFAGEQLNAELTGFIPSFIKKTGVFVDEPIDSVLRTAGRNKLDILQLHGSENPAYCDELRQHGYEIIKTAMIGDGFNYNNIEKYIDHINLFLFDTKGMLFGGSGVAFDWRILNEYPYNVPFILSGGISVENIEQVTKVRTKQLIAIDVNSKFEISPGIKDINKLRMLKDKLKEMK